MPEIRAYRAGDEAGIRRLFEVCHTRPLELDVWNWRYAYRTEGVPVTMVAVDAETGSWAPCRRPPRRYPLDRGSRAIKAGLWVDLMIEPKHRNLTLFLDLADANRRRCAETGVELLFAFPNGKSFPVLKRMLGWQDAGDITSAAWRARSPDCALRKPRAPKPSSSSNSEKSSTNSGAGRGRRTASAARAGQDTCSGATEAARARTIPHGRRATPRDACKDFSSPKSSRARKGASATSSTSGSSPPELPRTRCWPPPSPAPGEEDGQRSPRWAALEERWPTPSFEACGGLAPGSDHHHFAGGRWGGGARGRSFPLPAPRPIDLASSKAIRISSNGRSSADGHQPSGAPGGKIRTSRSRRNLSFSPSTSRS